MKHTPLPELPFPSEAFKSSWQDWQAFRKEIKKPLTPTSTKRQLAFLGAMRESDALASLDQSIRNGWQGLFPVARSITQSQTITFRQEGGGF